MLQMYTLSQWSLMEHMSNRFAEIFFQNSRIPDVR